MVLRLLPKDEVIRRKAEERRQEIDEGMKLAERIDTLRESRVREEKVFEAWQQETLEAIQREISSKQAERDQLEIELASRRRERDILLAPITKELEALEAQKASLAQQAEEIYQEQSALTQSRRSLTELERMNKEKEARLDSQNRKYSSLIHDAKEKVRLAKEAILEARSRAAKLNQVAEKRDAESRLRMKKAEDYEQHNILEKKKLENLAQELATREAWIIARELQTNSPVRKL